jgi:hypothetical protein
MEALVIFVIFCFFFQEKEKEKQSLRDFFFLFLLLSRFSWLWDDYLLYIWDVGLSSFFIVLYIAEMGVVGGLGMYEADKDGYIWTAGVINPTQISMGYGQREKKREREKKTHTITEDTALNLRLNPFILLILPFLFSIMRLLTGSYTCCYAITIVRSDQCWKWSDFVKVGARQSVASWHVFLTVPQTERPNRPTDQQNDRVGHNLESKKKKKKSQNYRL